MRIYHNIDDFKPLKKAVVTIGTFDGVHIGHRKIIARVKEQAEATGGVFDSAFADGANSNAFVGFGADFDSAIAVGDGSFVNAGFGGIFDTSRRSSTRSVSRENSLG